MSAADSNTAAAAVSSSPPATAMTEEERMVAYLLREDLWPVDEMLSAPDASAGAVSGSAADQQYLREHVFPTLVPALQDLSELVQRDNELGTANARATTRCVSRRHPTGAAGPVQWLAQYLYRHNLNRSDSLANHPYVVLSRAADNTSSSSSSTNGGATA